MAARKNNEEKTVELIRQAAPTDKGYFVIALANGGLISAARTFAHLGDEGDHKFGMVNFSMHKNNDREPNLYPYPDKRRRWLESMAADRRIVVFDEDHTSGATLTTATRYFANFFETQVVGIAPVELERRISYKPLVVTEYRG